MHTTTKINDLTLIEIEDFLSDIDVDNILNSRIQKFEKAISHYPNYYRNNDRLVENNSVLSDYLSEKLTRRQIPDLKEEITGINEKIRFCRYQKDQLFSRHQDGVYYPNSNHESKFTFLLYLNDNSCFEAGATEFYTSKMAQFPVKTIVPKKGKLVVFDHQIWHTGARVTKGNKYILRSDIMVQSNAAITNHQGYIWNLLRLNDNQFLSGGRDTKIKHWNTNLELLNTIEIHSKSVIKIISLQGNEFLSCSRDFTIKKWNLLGEVLAETHLDEMILNVANFKDELIIAVGTSGKMYVLDTNLKIIETIPVHHHWVWGLSIVGNSAISCCENGNICITNIYSKKTECLFVNDQPLFCINTEKRNVILAGAKDGTLIELSLETKKVTKTKKHNDIIRSIVYYNQYIISCGESNKIISFNENTKETIEVFVAKNFLQDIKLINGFIYVAGFDGIITKLKIDSKPPF